MGLKRSNLNFFITPEWKLKSDQDGIEMQLKSPEGCMQYVLKSDQDGIEIRTG